MRALISSKILFSTLLASFFALALSGCERSDDTSPGFDDSPPIEPAPEAPPVSPGNPPGGLPDAQ